MPTPRLIAANAESRGQAFVDGYTPVHALVGIAAGVLGITPLTAAVVFLGAKIVVASLERGMGHALFSEGRGESPVNELGDLTAELAGYKLGEWLRARSR